MVRKAGVGRAAQQPVQLVQLAALAFPADPPRFACVPDPPAMEQQEAVAAGRRAIALVEPGDAGCRRFQQCRVAVDMLGRGIDPVGEQSEMQIAFRAREVVDLQTLDLLLDRRRPSSAASAPRRACADARARRRAVPRRAAASRRSRASRRGSPARPPRRWRGSRPGRRAGSAMPRPSPSACSDEQRYGEEGRGDHGAGADIAADAERSGSGVRARRAAAAGSRSPPRTRGVRRREGDSRDRRGGLPRRLACAHVACFAARTARAAMSSSVRFGAARQFLDGAAIEIARREIHVAKRAAGGEHVVDQADALEQLGPIDVGDQAHAGDDVAHRDGRRRPAAGVRRARPRRPSFLARPGAGRARSAPA